ncbi:proteinase B [Tieghemiomyces parasiticus]|uniref:Proteinase B n=1 Tax=Tieghemiomyces parasiticus TaxID=78921 RepID=A0A9W8AFA4_9FUNG|nr:proteinase B [Tieghemiomyces parasiticus]
MVSCRLVIVAVLAWSSVQASSLFSAHPLREAPLLSDMTAEVVPDSYMVIFKRDVDADALHTHLTQLTTLLDMANLEAGFTDGDEDPNELAHVYRLPGLHGYAGRFQPDVLARIRGATDVVDYVEHDSIVYATDVQRRAPWGLARTSSRDTLSLRNFEKYVYDGKGGEGVTVYVVDTGVNINHVDLEGRARWGKTIPRNDEDEDGNGHGSHVAGTIAGKTYGVAKKAQIVAVKVLGSNGSGTMSDVVKGVEFTAIDHKSRNPKGTSIANMSLGGGPSRTLDMAVNAAVNHNVFFAVAAGNENADACGSSPASAEAALTVGASTIYDGRAYFSNFGKCVDVYAPGLNIRSIWKGSKTATNTISGTSMASPHVAGLAAYFLSLADEPISPAELKKMILDSSTQNKLTGLTASCPNKLIYNNPPSDLTAGLLY